MIIDFHTHAFADSIAKKAVSSLETAGGISSNHDGTIAGLRSHMKSCGIDRFVVHPVATKSSQVQIINDWAAANTDDTSTFFGALHPDDPDFVSAAQGLKELGFKGVKLHPDYQGFFADEDRMIPLYAALRDLGLIVVLHAGIDLAFPQLVRCTPQMIANILRQVPGITLVAAHMGGHALWRDVEALLVGKDVYLDTSYSFYQLQNEGMSRMIAAHSADKVLFGSDSPWKHAGEAASQIASLDLPKSDIDLVLGGNALRLLG